MTDMRATTVATRPPCPRGPAGRCEAAQDRAALHGVMERQQKSPLGKCGSYYCARSVVVDSVGWSDDVRLSDLERDPASTKKPPLIETATALRITRAGMSYRG
jgi:hypothetical protein